MGRRRALAFLPEETFHPTDVLTIEGVTVRPASLRLLGSGGEADVFDLGGGRALKVWKRRGHPDLLSEGDREGADARLALAQVKLPALLRLRFPTCAAAPTAPAFLPDGRIGGFTMPLVGSGEPLYRFGDPSFRTAGLPPGDVARVLWSLSSAVSAIHRSGAVVGDLNDRNVLVVGTDVRFVDVDSWQLAGFPCGLYTPRFLDPRLTDGRTLAPVRPHDESSDWYAVSLMLGALLLRTDPFGGVHAPAHGTRLGTAERALRGISVLSADVRIPRAALDPRLLPDPLRAELRALWEEGERRAPRLDLLSALRFVDCGCGTSHARDRCPDCAARVASPKPERAGRLRADVVLSGRGTVVAAEFVGGRLLWLVHDGRAYVREDGSTVLVGAFDRRVRFGLEPTATLASRGGTTMILGRSGVSGSLAAGETSDEPLVASAGGTRFWIADGRLRKDGPLGPETAGIVLDRLARIFGGPAFGLGFARAGAMLPAYLFEPAAAALRDVSLPPVDGTVETATATFSADRCWLTLTIAKQGVVTRRLLVVSRRGELLGLRESPDPDDWLVGLPGAAAAGAALFVPTDDGLVRVELQGTVPEIVAKFPETAREVDAATRLLAGPDAIYAVRRDRITALRLG